MIIYKVTNLLNDKVYVGQTTKTIEERWKQHCQLKRKRACRLLLAAINKYGKENFKIEILETINNLKDLNPREKYWIVLCESFGPKGYNLTTGGDRTELAQESKLKISQTLTGRPNGRKGIPTNRPAWNKGKPWSNEIKQKLSDSHKGQIAWCLGKKFTPEHCKKLSDSHMGKPNIAKRKSILCINNGQIYDSAKTAAKELNLLPSKICLVLKGIRYHTGGFKFIYA